MNHIILEERANILIITLNRPKVLNAINSELMDELATVIQDFTANDNLQAAILTGSGEKAFAAGADIAEIASLSEQEAAAFSRKGQQIFFSIENSPKPIIAAVNGYALGGGCELAMSCHMRIASENAVFGQPEIKLGLIAGYGGTQRLVQLIGKGKATELLITAANMNAQEALRYGLVNYVVPQEEIIATCEGILTRANKQSPRAIALTLQAISAGVNSDKGYEVEAQNFGMAVASEDAKEGTSAFLEKRKPLFTGK